ncbi:MAG TPA: NUDIX hydrolase [Ktedonobacterales bacterium]|nr:NUDIX hydrolase [Ktedonobacterales bacterium]
MSKRIVTYAFSAGGVVFRQPTASGDIEVVLVGRQGIWTLPKGTPALGETREMTALREVREETGLDVRIVNEIGTIEYVFTRKGRLVKKQVFHYLMIAVGGSVEAHDHEYDEARWFPLEEALRNLSYDNEQDIVRQAEPFIRAWLAKPPAERNGD